MKFSIRNQYVKKYVILLVNMSVIRKRELFLHMKQIQKLFKIESWNLIAVQNH
jgi:tmRNA-binding protein